MNSETTGDFVICLTVQAYSPNGALVGADAKSLLNAGEASRFIRSCHGRNCTTMSGDHHVGN